MVQRGVVLAATIAAYAGAVASPPAPAFRAFADGVYALQESMIAQARAVDPGASWTYEEHERGRACVVEDGAVWEKGCISVTLIEEGELSAARAAAISGRTDDASIVAGAEYSACALSFVLHARSPKVPTLRGDARVFSVAGRGEWFGGGVDLTPSVVVPEDCRSFHEAVKALCAAHGADYDTMKRTCDAYFYLPARQEHRGVGGVFFDDLQAPFAAAFAQDLMRSALAADGPYLPIVAKRRDEAFTDGEKHWQLLRRGRYVEFNLLYDRGVKFGLSPETVERVLVSSPPVVAFGYRREPATPAEVETVEVLREPRTWVR